jgi:hypothetical protein
MRGSDRARARAAASAIVDPACRYARASALRASTVCRCGQPLSAHSPQWPHDSVACEAWQQDPKTFVRSEASGGTELPSSPAGCSPVSEPPQRGGVRRSRPRGEGGAVVASAPDDRPGLAWTRPREADDREIAPLGKIAGSVSTGKNARPGEGGKAVSFPRGAELELEKDAALRRYRLKEALRPIQIRRPARCGKRRIAPSVQVQRASDQQTIGLSGTVTCGSPWSCPTCACRIYTKRAADIRQAAENWAGPLELRGDGSVSMLTLTVRHGVANDLGESRRTLTKGWRRLFQGRAGQQLRRALGIKHHVRALEVTHGANGWHPHLHVMIFHSKCPEPGSLAFLQERWMQVIASIAPHATPDLLHGADLRPSHRTDYVAKLGLEVASILAKRGKKGSRSPWQIADDARHGDVDARRLWVDYTEAMHGARQLTWSRNARRALGLCGRDTDEDAVAEPPSTLLVAFPAEVWDSCTKLRGWLVELHRRARGPTPHLDCSAWLRVSSAYVQGSGERPTATPRTQ